MEERDTRYLGIVASEDSVMAITDESYFDWPLLPETPSSLRVSLNGNSARLNWELHGADPKGTLIEKLQGNDSQWKRIAIIENGATEYADSGLSKGARPAYRVRTYNDAGESAYSNIVHVTVLGK